MIGSPTPYCFSLQEMRAVGFVVEAGDAAVWPGYADVFLHVHPQPTGGLSFYYFPDGMTPPEAQLPRWAVDAVEQGGLHACFVGGPGGIPLTDLRIELRAGRWDPLRSGERAFFVAGYMAVRQAVHLACVEGPLVLEYMNRVRLRSLAVHEAPLLRELQRAGASGVMTTSRPATHECEIVAVLPKLRVSAVRELCERLNRVGRSGQVEVEAFGYRSHTARSAAALMRQLGPPVDWPRDGGEVPQLGDPFPALPQAIPADRP